MKGKTGVFAGKFLPPHRGHLNAIIHAATQVEKLYVVVSDNAIDTYNTCKKDNISVMPMKLRALWLSKELQGFSHIKVLMLDETNIPSYPAGWREWSGLLIKLIPEHIDILFGGEPEYKEVNDTYFPTSKYILYDSERERYPISATTIRKNPLLHWDYILGSARYFFAKRILISGTESCGKTTITKYLAKIYNTSWSEEYGRYYSERHLGGNEDLFTSKDFYNIAKFQYEQDMDALRKANRIVFYDSDAVVTQFYCQAYLGESNKDIEEFCLKDRYDYILMFTPDVKWVDDGLRFMGEEDERWKNHYKLLNMYRDRGFGDKITIIHGDYSERLTKTLRIIDDILEVKK